MGPHVFLCRSLLLSTIVLNNCDVSPSKLMLIDLRIVRIYNAIMRKSCEQRLMTKEHITTYTHYILCLNWLITPVQCLNNKTTYLM